MLRPENGSLPDFLKSSRQNGWVVLGTGVAGDVNSTASGSSISSKKVLALRDAAIMNCREVSRAAGVILVVGSEGRGLRKEVRVGFPKF